MTIEATSAVGTAGVTGTNGIHSRVNGTGEAKQTLDNEVFLHLLVTQLRNQDPSSPMDTNQMIAQSTQLAMMEQLSALSTTGEDAFSLQMRSTAASLLGRSVDYLDADGSTHSGEVSSVSFAGAVPQLLVDGIAVRLDSILGLTAASPTTSTTV